MTPSRSDELSFTGPATFFKAPLLAPAKGTLEGAGKVPVLHDSAILGMPYDFAVGFRPGARFAPAALRAASGRLALPPDGLYDLAADRRRLAGIDIVDAGDVDILQLDTEANFARISEAATRLRTLAALPVFVGGDHSISYPLLRAYRASSALHVVQFDAHLDYSLERNGTRLSNSSPFRRAFEDVGNLSGRTVVGLRGMRTDQEAAAAARSASHDLITAEQVHEEFEAVLERLPRGEQIYLSLDVDVLDPAELPGTSSPEPGGLDFRQLKRLLTTVIEGNELIGVDLTELAPQLDPSGRSELLAARLLAEVLASWWDRSARRTAAG